MIFMRVLLVKSLNLNGSNIFISWFIFIFIYFYLSVSIVEILLILEIWGNNQSKISRHVNRQKKTLILEKVYGTDFCILCQEIQRIIHDKLTGTIISSFVLNGFFCCAWLIEFFMYTVQWYRVTNKNGSSRFEQFFSTTLVILWWFSWCFYL